MAAWHGVQHAIKPRPAVAPVLRHKAATGGRALTALDVSLHGGQRGFDVSPNSHVERLYNKYNITAAFTVASLLAMLVLITLVLKSLLQWKTIQKMAPEESGYTGD